MAGEWIKWQRGLVNKPEVAQIARALGVTRPEAAGRLMMVWEYADETTADGRIVGVGPDDVDAIAGVIGMAHCMASTKPWPWLVVEEDGLSFPNFDRHNGKNAKRRAMEKNRQELHRNATGKESGYRPWHGKK